MEHILLFYKDLSEGKKTTIHKHTQYGHTISAFQLSELDTLDCLRKQPCLALLTLAASLLCTTMKLRVASCNLTHSCWIVERKCDTRRNRINSVPFNGSCAGVTYRTCSYFFIECTSSFFLSTLSTSSSPLTSLLSFSDVWWLHSRLPWSLYLQKDSYATTRTHIYTCK